MLNFGQFGAFLQLSAKQHEANGATTVAMTTTTPGCPATIYLKQGVQDRTSAVDGVKKVQVELTYEPRWEPEMMSPEAKQHLGIY